MRFSGTVIAVMLLLGACTSDPPPPSLPSSTAPSSSAPTAASPTMPPQATEDSPEGAAAFVKHYVNVFNHAAATGDIEELTRLSSPDCTGCHKYIDLYRETYAAGGYFKGGEWELGELSMKYEPAASEVTTTVSTGGSHFKTTSDADEKRSIRSKSRITFAIDGGPDSRQITQMALAGSS